MLTLMAIFALCNPSLDDQRYNIDNCLRNDAFREAACAAAVDMELMSKSEWIFRHNDLVISDLMIIETRYVELKNAPCAGDAMRFPPLAGVRQCLWFVGQYEDHINAIKILYPYDQAYFRSVLEDIAEVKKFYLKLADLQYSWTSVYYKRKLLKELREQLGNDLYYTGPLPSFVPLKHFKEIK